MGHGGNELHLQLRQLNRSRHLDFLNGPNRRDRGYQGNRQDRRHSDNGASRGGVHVG